jgi:hypothetical protein
VSRPASRGRTTWVRLVAPVTAAAVVLTGAVTATVTGLGVERRGDLLSTYDRAAAHDRAARGAGEAAHAVADGAHAHDHTDPATKNAVSRAGVTSQRAQDPTSAQEKVANAAAVAAGRDQAPPRLTTRPATMSRAVHPATRYAMANGCYTLTDGGEPLYFKPTTLGRYLLHDADRRFVVADGRADQPSAETIWTARRTDGRTRFVQDGVPLAFEGRSSFVPTRSGGCARYPESQVNVSGGPFAGTSDFQEVRGYVDAHTHGMAFEFLGGGAHCGKPWDRFGAPYALVDCPDHQSGTNPLEAALSGEPTHDPVGWPTFEDWPAPESLTHEGTYYTWMERSWRGGLRVFVNLLVENNQLCRLYPFGEDGTPLSKNSCDDMDSIRLQAKRMYQLQDYVDAQWGGPGKGWYRIVTNPWEARRVVNDGKLAVVMGIETSVPFGCTFKAVLGEDVPAAECTKESIDEQLDEVRALGVRQMELVNKFDNALSGVAGDEGSTGAVVNNANFLETGSYWDMRHCEPEDPEAHDRNQYAAPGIDAEQQDALFGAIGEIWGLTGSALPLYPPPDHCNRRGLTDLGAHLVDRLADEGMLVDPDHMSVEARDSLLDLVEERDYPGVISSHSWSTPDAYPRIYDLGGFVAPYAGDSTGFVAKWRRHLEWANPKYFFGIGYGADINGLGAQGDPRGADVSNPVTYPFEGLGGVTIHRQHAGQRVYDINVDGVAQYGLYPDWIEDLTKVADAESGDGAAIREDMARGAEAYLQTWERAQGVAPDPCRNPGLRVRAGRFDELVRPGMSSRTVMEAVGQPFLRRDLTYTYCASSPSGEVRMAVDLTRAGRVSGVRRAG